MATGTYAPDPAFTGFDNNGDPLNAGKLYTYAAGSTTPLATFSDVSLDPAFQNANPVILDSAGRCTLFLSPTSYKFILKTSADVTVWTRDNISAVPTTNVNLDIDGVAGEAITAGQVVYLSDGSGGKTAGRWYLADADFTYASTLPAIGMAPSAIDAAATGSIRLQGRITGLSGLVAGTTYYVSATAGALTATSPANSRAVGAADTTTSLVVFSTTSNAAASASQAGIVTLSAQQLGAGVKTIPAHSKMVSGTGTGFGLFGGVMSLTQSSASNSGAGETDLLSYTVPANTLDTDGNSLRITAAGSFAANANGKTLKLYCGATSVAPLNGITVNVASNRWRINGTIVRTGASAEYIEAIGISGVGNGSGGSLGLGIVQGTAAIATNATIAVKITGQGTSNADITQDLFIVEVIN